MSAVGEAFINAFGKPDPAVPRGFRFRDAFDDKSWSSLQSEIGSGWYLNRFLFLFAKGAERMKACLNAWDFLVPPNRDRIILGRNAYGAILVMDDANHLDHSIHVLDPFRVVYWTDANLTLTNMIGAFLPERLIPHFLDDTLYKKALSTRKARLGDDEILAPRKPLGLGGNMDLDSFQVEKIVPYYKSTAAIYRKAFAKMGRPPTSPSTGRKK